MGLESYIASMSIGLSSARVATDFSVGMLKKGLESSELAASQMIEQINNYVPVSVNDIGGLIDVKG